MIIDLDLVNQYLALQEGLLAALCKERPVLFSGPPRGNGMLPFLGDSWAWQGHGAGIRFERSLDLTVIDAHDSISDAKVFDAWRLVQFAESIQVAKISFDDAFSAILELVESGSVLELTTPQEPAGGRRFKLCKLDA